MTAIDPFPIDTAAFVETVPQEMHSPATSAGNQPNLFRNVPDNPFWGVPASIDWAEWDEWYRQNQNWESLNGT